LCVLSCVVIVGILRNFGALTLGVAIFLSLFPMIFAIAAELIKGNALKTGLLRGNRHIFKTGGMILILGTLGFGAVPPFLEIWGETQVIWEKVILAWLALAAVINIIVQLSESKVESKRMAL